MLNFVGSVLVWREMCECCSQNLPICGQLCFATSCSVEEVFSLAVSVTWPTYLQIPVREIQLVKGIVPRDSHETAPSLNRSS
jgi:hypothetical protein